MGICQTKKTCHHASVATAHPTRGALQPAVRAERSAGVTRPVAPRWEPPSTRKAALRRKPERRPCRARGVCAAHSNLHDQLRVCEPLQPMSLLRCGLCPLGRRPSAMPLGCRNRGARGRKKNVAIAPGYARRVCWRGSASRSVSKLLRKIAAAPQSNTASKLVWSINHPTNGEETNGTARQTLRALT